MAADPLGGDKHRARATEGVVEALARPEVVADRRLEEDERFLGRVIELLLWRVEGFDLFVPKQKVSPASVSHTLDETELPLWIRGLGTATK